MKDLASRAALIAGFILLLGIIFSRDFRLGLGLAVDPLLSPLAHFKFHVTIFILSIITGMYSNAIQKATVDFRRMKEIQQKVTEFQKEYMDAMKKNNKAKLERLEKMQPEIRQLQNELFSMQMKPMGYTFLVTIPIFSWLWEKAIVSYELAFGSSSYGNVTQHLPESFVSGIDPNLFYVVVPFAGKIHVASTFFFPWWLFWYLICSVAIGQVIRRALGVGV